MKIILNNETIMFYRDDELINAGTSNSSTVLSAINNIQAWCENFKTPEQEMLAGLEEQVNAATEQLQTLQERYQEVLSLYPEWTTKISVKVGDRLVYKGTLYEVIQKHTTQADWAPDITPSLFKLATGGLSDESGEIILDFVQPTGAHDAYQKGDKVKWTDGKIYASTIANNVYSPTAYPQGWKVVTQ